MLPLTFLGMLRSIQSRPEITLAQLRMILMNPRLLAICGTHLILVSCDTNLISSKLWHESDHCVWGETLVFWACGVKCDLVWSRRQRLPSSLANAASTRVASHT